MYPFRSVRFNFESLHDYGVHRYLVEKHSWLNMLIADTQRESQRSRPTESSATDFR
jgi:hypothetical protein